MEHNGLLSTPAQLQDGDRQAESSDRQAESSNSHLKLFAAGFNAHSQLDPKHRDDVHAFTPTAANLDEKSVDVLFAGWSSTVLISGSRIWSLGHQQLDTTSTTLTGAEGQQSRPRCAFGDHNGIVGFLDHGASLTRVVEVPSLQDVRVRLATVTIEASPSLSHVALAGNDRIAVTFKQAPNGRLCHLAEFDNLERFFMWYEDPSGEGNYPGEHHMLPGRPKQLLANTATFLLLMEDGEVYSWGDPRHQSLGRPIVGDGAAPADKPGMVEAVGGLRIRKLASDGWLSAALSEDGALYLWGAGMPGADKSIKCLREAGAGEVALVDLPGEGGEPLDVIDVAVGDGHVAAVAADHRLYVVGDNRNGQLGLGSEEDFFEDWTVTALSGDIHRVVCGPKATFAFAGDS